MSNRTTTPPTQPHSGDQYALRPGAKALVSSSETVLLIKERHDDGTPFWTLPGGGVDPQEHHRMALQRELKEELGCHGVIGQPVGTLYYSHCGCSQTFSVYRVFDCNLLGQPTPNCAEGVQAVQWVQPDSPPAQTLPQVAWLLRQGRL